MVTLDANSKITRDALRDDEVKKINNHFFNFGYTLDFSGLAKLYYNNEATLPGDLIRNMNMIVRVLLLEGFTSEEAIEFLYNNKKYIITNNNDLHLKFAILRKVGLLSEVLRTNPNLLLRINGIKTERLYALLCYAKARGQRVNAEFLSNPNISKEAMDKLAREYSLTELANSLLNNNLESELKIFELEKNNENNLKRN